MEGTNSNKLNKRFKRVDFCILEHQVRSNVQKIITSIGNVLYVYPAYEFQKHVIQKVFHVLWLLIWFLLALKPSTLGNCLGKGHQGIDEKVGKGEEFMFKCETSHKTCFTYSVYKLSGQFITKS